MFRCVEPVELTMQDLDRAGRTMDQLLRRLRAEVPHAIVSLYRR